MQCFEGKPLFEFDRARMFRSGLVGFTLHGSLSHYYYQFCEVEDNDNVLFLVLFGSWNCWLCGAILSGFSFNQELFPYKEWWVVPAKVAFDQTAWSAVWNSIYYTVVALLRFDSPISIFNELKATFFPMLTVRKPTGFFLFFMCCVETVLFHWEQPRTWAHHFGAVMTYWVGVFYMNQHVSNLLSIWLRHKLMERMWLFAILMLLHFSLHRQGGNYGHLPISLLMVWYRLSKDFFGWIW